MTSRRVTQGVAALLCMVVSPVPFARAAEATTAADASGAPAQSSPAPSSESPSSEALLRELLRGTRWGLELRPLPEQPNAGIVHDVLTFDEQRVTSERLAKDGYGASRYSVAFDGGIPVWETVQLKPGQAAAFWRGELSGATVHGLMSQHPVQGKPADFSFSGRELGGKAVAPAAEGTHPPGETERLLPAEDAMAPSEASIERGASGEAPPDEGPKKTPSKRRRFWLF